MVRFKNAFQADKFVGGGFDELPDGVYSFQLMAAERRTSRAGNDMLVLEWKVLSGEYENRRLSQFINMWHSNPDVRSIAFEEFAHVCQALGVTEVEDTDELLFREAEAFVVYQNGYPRFKNWEPVAD